jgi:hypothetical protein
MKTDYIDTLWQKIESLERRRLTVSQAILKNLLLAVTFLLHKGEMIKRG